MGRLAAATASHHGAGTALTGQSSGFVFRTA